MEAIMVEPHCLIGRKKWTQKTLTRPRWQTRATTVCCALFTMGIVLTSPCAWLTSYLTETAGRDRAIPVKGGPTGYDSSSVPSVILISLGQSLHLWLRANAVKDVSRSACFFFVPISIHSEYTLTVPQRFQCTIPLNLCSIFGCISTRK